MALNRRINISNISIHFPHDRSICVFQSQTIANIQMQFVKNSVFEDFNCFLIIYNFKTHLSKNQHYFVKVQP